MYEWNLDRIYNGFGSKEFNDDFESLKKIISDIKSYDISVKGDINVFKGLFKLDEKMTDLIDKLFGYTSLRLSVNSNDMDAIKAYGKLQGLNDLMTESELKIKKYIKRFPKFMDIIKEDNELKEFEYVIFKLYDSSKRSLSDETEILLSKLERSSGSAWEQLFTTLTSNLEVEFQNQTLTLSDIRNLAYSPLEDVRKEAYEAELKSYKKIDKSLAQTITSIKQEFTVMSEARGYKSPLDKTLKDSGMTKKTLNALISSIEDYLPVFRKYLKRKGKMLGHKNGLPFYDIFAPVGSSETVYSVEEANKYLIDKFNAFNPEIGSMIDKATKNEWIDYCPRAGKSGGAFCANAASLKESRILTNFDGTFGSVVTLAHELGHAFHNEVLKDKSILYQGYPMQLAETASTFNETYIKDDAIKNAKDKEELLNILETAIADDTQVIVDILSRYYFETSVFEKSQDGALTSEELCDLMKDAQLRSYGSGLDKNFLHPYMWCPKSHYYSTGLSFYNFPYAFGQLFAYGLYSIYLEKGDEFFPLYKKILTTAGTMPIRECVLQAGIDTDKKDFWKRSLDLIKERIEKFLELTK